MSTDVTWWVRVADSVRAAGRGEAPIEEPVRMLRDGLGFDCAALIGRQRTLASSRQPIIVNLDYPTEVADFIATTHAFECAGHRYAIERRVALRFIDLPFDVRDTITYQEALRPCGFHEGITLPLGRYTGSHPRPAFVAMSSLHGRALADDARLALTMLAAELAGLAAPQIRPDPESADVVVHVSPGRVEPRLGDSAESPLDASALRRVATLLSPGSPPLRFRRRGDNGQWWSIRADAGGDGVLITLRRTDPPAGLTPRELDVVGLVSRGWPNDEIANALGISVRTARSHVESALIKVGVSNRTALARAAWERGLDSWDAVRCARG
ncbi:helix-turn-helix transcriptional regulator [Gordonia paraffinivorans]|uniref:helix-turn-helix transcriptional regulator n=1 Tax=Gordonia paraffinivorans TaxID=175628 RepID=UPI0027DF26E0|nr:helix-turn-helix transcriptional regulator [Gordonia paraffinivorans]